MRALLLPLWSVAIEVSWETLKFLKRPVKYSAGNNVVMLYPEGQIAEAVWKSQFERVERDFVEAFIQPGMRVVNVGANIGLFEVMASKLTGPGGEVHAFEPSESTHARLLANLRLNECRNVTAVRIALSDAPGRLLLRCDPRHPSLDGHCFVEPLGPGTVLKSDVIIDATTLDRYLDELTPPGVDLIIIDVEGAELSVLEGGIRSLTRFRPTLCVECSRHQKEIEILLAGLGYRFWVWDMHRRALMPAALQEAARVGNVIARAETWAG